MCAEPRASTTWTNVSKDLRARLQQAFTLARPEIVSEQISKDGTRKWLLRIPRPARSTVAPRSSASTFPRADAARSASPPGRLHAELLLLPTGTQKLVRNLTAQEIVAQALVARDRLGDYPGRAGAQPREGSRLVSNIVFMGMGEPLLQFRERARGDRRAGGPEGLQLSKRASRFRPPAWCRRSARSAPRPTRCWRSRCTHTNDALRDVLVPLNKKYPIAELLEACRTYPGVSNARRITFEYVMLKGVNDSLAEAKQLVRLLKGIPAKINLIPFNPWPGSNYECSDWEQIERFSQYVFDAGYSSAGAHAARPRHPRGLRPAQERDREAPRPGRGCCWNPALGRKASTPPPRRRPDLASHRTSHPDPARLPSRPSRR